MLVEKAVFGTVRSDLMDTFLQYVSESERQIFEACRSHFESVDQEELLDVLSMHRRRCVPTAANFEQILGGIAHLKLIQEPTYVIGLWSNTLAPMKSELEGITAIHEDLQPTS